MDAITGHYLLDFSALAKVHRVELELRQIFWILSPRVSVSLSRGRSWSGHDP